MDPLTALAAVAAMGEQYFKYLQTPAGQEFAKMANSIAQPIAQGISDAIKELQVLVKEAKKEHA